MKFYSKPVRYLVTRLARAYGFLDPVAILARLRDFSQPSEVGEPIELLRAGLLFHARGLVNTKAIQHNLDWVWPYWVERQFNPDDPSFIPRAFSFSHINLTHRNWTAVGLPDVPFYPIVDPRGLVTPMFDGWSLDFWFVPESGPPLFPSKLADFSQGLSVDGNLAVQSRAARDEFELASRVHVAMEGSRPCCIVQVRPGALGRGHVAVALRPYNPEGVSAIQRIELLPDGHGWRIDRRHEVWFSQRPSRHLFSSYAEGDVSLRLNEQAMAAAVHCPAGMATGVLLFPAERLAARPLELRVPIYDELKPHRPASGRAASWPGTLRQLTRLQLPDPRYGRLYDLARASVVLHTPGEVYPGPYTYKRFWFRDAVFILHALLMLGGVEQVRRAMQGFARRQRRDGYFLSQNGEWDSNGEALWLYARFSRLTGEVLPADWCRAVRRGQAWIRRKRLAPDLGRPEAGLLPAGFSAEHLGPNDYYYWDDFWAVAGLHSAAEVLAGSDPAVAAHCREEAAEFLATIERSIPSGPQRRFPGTIPASPCRRMDSGAVGSLVADYPLQLFPAGDPRILRTADFLRARCFRHGLFLQDMVHSGLNIYLTLHLAQVWLRAGQPGPVWKLMERIADIASPTGQWPEAIHPRTRGGCMGDGQHIWAAAEWLVLLRNLCVREEGGRLVLGSGIALAWLQQGAVILEPTLTPHGPVGVHFSAHRDGVRIMIGADWRGAPPEIELCVPGCARRVLQADAGPMELILPYAA